jgi:hypothetical protein
MTSKPAGADVIPIFQYEGETEARAVARRELRPTVGAARTLSRVLAEDAPDLALTDLCDELHELAGKVVAGDMRRPEALLLVQAETLNALFNGLVRAAHDNLSHHSAEAERLLRLGFKAQAQARATLETLSALKNPPVVFAKNIQANIATNGAKQQVNNVARAHPQENDNSGQEQTIGETHGERLDTGTTSSASRGDPPLETVGAIERPANGQG